MFSKEELAQRYETLSEEELYSNYKQLDTLSTDGQNALHEVIEKKGGIEQLTASINNKVALAKEKARIVAETKQFAKTGPGIDFIKRTTTSSILHQDEVDLIVEEAYAGAEAEQRDKTINPKTISGSIIGGLIASITGGTLWGIWLIETHRIFYIFIVGLGFISYLIINRMTRQSKNNVVVIAATIISTILATILGYLIFEFSG